MEDFIVILDTCQYSVKENGTCILTGWMFTAGGKPFVQARAGHVPLECRMKRIPRPDVLAARPDLDFSERDVGFEIRIPNMEQIFSLADTFRVRMYCEGKSFPLVQMEMSQAREEYCADTLRYFIEFVEKRRDKLCVQGWCVNTVGEPSLRVLDFRGNPQEGAAITKMRRPDLAEAFDVPLSQCRGFLLEIPRQKIRGRSLCLEFSNRLTKKEKNIDMAKFDWENTRVGRILKDMGAENRTKNQELLSKVGVRGFVDYLLEESGSFADPYGYFEKRNRPTAKELKRQAEEAFPENMKISIIVPVYHTPKKYLKDLVDSVMAQSYRNWQLCLADGSEEDSLETFIRENYKDERICYRHLEENKGISGNTNAAVAMAQGEYIAFADHDDMLAPDALYHMARVFREYPQTELVYSDEDLIDAEGKSCTPHFKPDFNLDYLRCINYICHFVVVKKKLLDRVGPLRGEFDGAQDYDLLLRCTEHTRDIRHVPRVLYHWRSYEGSTAGNQEEKPYAVEAGRRALAEHYSRMGIEAETEFTGTFIVYRTKFKIQGNPRVSILIPNKDHHKDLEKCIVSIMEKSTYRNLQIIVIENNSEEPETFLYYETLKKRYPEMVKVIVWDGEFNYPAINNFGAAHADGDYLLLLNNDTEVITADWLERLLGYCQREDVGVAGAKLFYPDNTVQHAGVVIGLGGFAGHILTGLGRNNVGYMGRLLAAQDVSAVTGACLMTKRSIFEELHGLDEKFGVALNDVDFCLRVRALGKLVVFVPDAKLYHYESRSRGLETSPEKKERFRREISLFQERYAEILKQGDPYYNPNLSLVRGDCSLRGSYETVKGNKV